MKEVNVPLGFPDEMTEEEIAAAIDEQFAAPRPTDEIVREALQEKRSYARSVQLSLQDKVSRVIGEALFDAGIITDKRRAFRTGQTLGTGISFTPAGAAFGGDEFGRAAKEGDYLGMGLGALEALGIAGDAAGPASAIFAGIMAKGADLKKLRDAKRMEVQGADRDEIWTETGWFNDNGDWKWEISDQGTELKADVNTSEMGEFGGIMNAPGVEQGYPDLLTVPTYTDPAIRGGGLNTDYEAALQVRPQDMTVSIGTRGGGDEARRTGIHEIQHAIQQMEGFQTGANIDSDTILNMKRQIGNKTWDTKRQFLDAEKQYKEAVSTYGPDSMQANNARRKVSNRQADMQKMDELEQKFYGMSNVDVYKRSAGEAEARLAETRINMSPEERRARPPWYDLDVPESELVRFDNGARTGTNLSTDGPDVTTSDGFSFYKQPDGTYTDNIDPEASDMTFNSIDDLTAEMGEDLVFAGDDISRGIQEDKRKALMDDYVESNEFQFTEEQMDDFEDRIDYARMEAFDSPDIANAELDAILATGYKPKNEMAVAAIRKQKQQAKPAFQDEGRAEFEAAMASMGEAERGQFGFNAKEIEYVGKQLGNPDLTPFEKKKLQEEFDKRMASQELLLNGFPLEEVVRAYRQNDPVEKASVESILSGANEAPLEEKDVVARAIRNDIIGELPVVDPQMLVGSKVKVAFGDIMRADQDFTGVGRIKTEPTPQSGGPLFPMLQSSQNIVDPDTGETFSLAWAANTKEVAQKLVNGVEGEYIMFSSMTPTTHKSNAETNIAYGSMVKAFLEDGRLSPEQLSKVEKSIKGKKSLRDFPGFTSPDYNEWVRSQSFGLRGGEFFDSLNTQLAAKAGMPNISQVLDETLDQRFAGNNYGDSMVIVKVNKDDPVVELGTKGTKVHPSYKWGIKGEVVGRFNKPVSYREVQRDFLSGRRQEGKPEVGDNYSAMLSTPIQTITPEIANDLTKIVNTDFKYLKTPRQAVAYNDFIEGNWTTPQSITQQAQERGVKVERPLNEFIEKYSAELRRSKYAPSLSGGSPADMKKKVRDGDLNIYQLGNTDIFFGIENTDYSWAVPGMDNVKAISGVINNQNQVLKGVGLPSVMLKAIEEGAEALDAFAVKTDAFPNGFLPTMYARYGFEEAGRVPFDKDIYLEDHSAADLADLEAVWRDDGWDGADYPEVVIMNYTGSNEGRQNARTEFIDNIRAASEPSANPGAIASAASKAGNANGPGAGQTGRGVGTGQGDGAGNPTNAQSGDGIPAPSGVAGAVRELEQVKQDELLRRNLGLNYTIE